MTLKRRAQPKPVRERDTPHLVFIRTLRCALCAREGRHTPGPNDAMHVSFLAPGGKGHGSKAPDRFTVPGCRMHHDEQTNSGLRQVPEAVFWATSGIKVASLCADLHASSGDFERCEAIIIDHASRNRLGKVIRGGELLEPQALTHPVLLQATTSGARDESGNLIVHLPTLGPRGTPPTRAAVDPNSIVESAHGAR